MNIKVVRQAVVVVVSLATHEEIDLTHMQTSGTSKTSNRGPKSYDGPGNIHGNDPKAPPAYEVDWWSKIRCNTRYKTNRERARVKLNN